MWFLINRFILNAKRDYSLEIITKSKYANNCKHCDMYIKKLDPGLRDMILAMVYHPIIGYDDSNYPIYGTRAIASSIGCGKDTVYIRMNDHTYAQFISKLSSTIREYYDTHSRIDTINGKK